MSPKYVFFGVKLYQINAVSTNFYFMVNKEIFLQFRQKYIFETLELDL